jgi:hypothetical protein
MFFSLEFNKKGFIGAIGDDLPSLIPIVVALLLFFTIFSITINSYNSKNFELQKNLGLISISRALKGDSLILNVDQFKERCDFSRLNIQEYNYRSAIYSNKSLGEIADASEKIIDEFKDFSSNSNNFLEGETIFGSTETFTCEYLRPGAKELDNKSTDYLVRFYPVAVQRDVLVDGREYLVVVPSVMAMVIWE